MSGSSPQHCQVIDLHLKNQYHQICFNQAKKHVLARLTSNRTPEESPTHSHLSNAMLWQYMDSVYEHYGIEDPIGREMRLAKRSLEPSHQKSLNLTQVSESDRLTRTKRKLINLKDSFKRDSLEVVYSSQLITQDSPNSHINASPEGRSRLNRQIGYKTKEKMHFRTLMRESQVRQRESQVRQRESQVRQRESQVRQTVKPTASIESKSRPRVHLNNPEEMQLGRAVPAVFRYCPMCEVAVLECNIITHQNSCKEIQRVYRMPYPQIAAIISHKIKRVEAEIEREFLLRDEKRVAEDFTQLRQSVRLWMRKEGPSLQNVQGQFDRFACDTAEKISKLNWFRRLHATVSSRQSLEEAMQ